MTIKINIVKILKNYKYLLYTVFIYESKIQIYPKSKKL